MEFGIQELEFRGKDSGLRVECLSSRVQVSGLRV
jgi:hypothetical protein